MRVSVSALPALPLSPKLRTNVSIILLLCGCAHSTPAPDCPVTASDPYGYEAQDDPLGALPEGLVKCDATNCKPPLACLEVVTDSTLEVPDRESRSYCVSRDSDLCRLDPAACKPPPPP